MKKKLKQIIFCFYIYLIYLSHNILCQKNNNNYEDNKCVYILTKTGSEIINFHKFSKDKFKFSSSININDTEIKKWSINLCNDTLYTKFSNDDNNTWYDSQIVYTNNMINYRLTGAFLKKNNNNKAIHLIENNGEYIYQAQLGGECKGSYYNTSIIFNNYNVEDKECAELYYLPNNVEEECNHQIKLYFNLDYAKDYLILQKVLNDGYLIIGIIFIILGIYLCFFSFQNLKVTKIIICLIFGQIKAFCFEILIIGNSTALKANIYILIIIIGFIISCPFIYFSLKYDKLYLFLLAFCSGFINGIYVFDMCFIGTNCSITIDILINVVIIFTISFIVLMKILPKNHFFYPPIIGSYILIRGISLIIYNASGKLGYRDLQLLIYLIQLYENDLVEHYLKNDFGYFWIYIILIGLILILTEIYNYSMNKKKKNNEEDLIDNEEEVEENDREMSNASLNINDNNRSNSQ